MASPEARRGIVRKLVAHLRAGTLGRRFAMEVRRWASPRKAMEQRARKALARAWESVEGTGGWVDVRLLGGATLRLHGDSALGGYICRHSFEETELLFLHRFLRPGDVFVDVGANLGLFTVAAARRVGPTGKVIAFEPGSRARRRLEENVRLNRLENTTVLPYALSSSDARLALSVPVAGLEAFGSLAQPIVAGDLEREEIEARTWDGLEADLLGERPVTMMKIDVEGWERFVLSGAGRALSNSAAPLLQVEFTDAAAANAGCSCAELYGALRRLGFDVCRYDVGEGVLVPEEIRPEYPYVNLFATKDLVAANERLRGRRPPFRPPWLSVFRLSRVAFTGPA